jgi:hypothetical protein
VWSSATPFNEIVAGIPAKQFQVRQPDPTTIEVRYVADGSGREVDLDQIAARFGALIGRPITLFASQVEEIQRTATGKHERIISAVAN